MRWVKRFELKNAALNTLKSLRIAAKRIDVFVSANYICKKLFI